MSATLPNVAALRKQCGLPAAILHGTQSRLWETRVSNAGVWSVTTPRRALATDRFVPDGVIAPKRATLIASDNQAKAYRLSVDDSDPENPTVTATETPLGLGGYDGFPVYSDNGREWFVSVNAAGAISVGHLGANWIADRSPVLLDSRQGVWSLSVATGGILAVSNPGLPNPLTLKTIPLRAQDDSKVWKVTVGTDGILSVSDTGTSLQDTPYYDAELLAPDGGRWRLQVSADGVLSVFDVRYYENQRPTSLVFLAQNSKGLYVFDKRFRSPNQTRNSWGWERWYRRT